jgi:hypothetical protein
MFVSRAAAAASAAPEWSLRPGVRLAIGAAYRWAERPELGVAWDLTAVFRVLTPAPRPHRLGFVIEAGRSHADFVGPLDLYVVGVGPLFAPRGELLGVAWMPRLVHGTSAGLPATGVRNGLVLDAVGATFEIAHDYLRVDTPIGPYAQHGVRAMLNIDVIQLAGFMIRAAAED